MDIWERRWVAGITSVMCLNLRENFYKMIYCWYVTKMYKGISNQDWRCIKHEGTCWIKINMMRKKNKINMMKKPKLFHGTYG